MRGYAIWDIGAGGQQRVTITATVQGGPRTMRNYATAAAVTDDPAPQNNTDTETTQVIR